MKQYQVDLSPNLINPATQGSMDTSILNGNSIQRTMFGITVVDENNNRKMVGQVRDGQIFDDVVSTNIEDTILIESDAWEDRPAQWLTLPDVRTSDKFVGLVAIYPDSNFLALTVEGDYTVDWGDGTVENFNSGDTAERQYNYDDISSDGESALGYRQVIVQITPQEGNDITSIDLEVNHSLIDSAYSHPWLEVNVNCSSLSYLKIAQDYNGRWLNLKSFSLYANSLEDMSYMFAFSGIEFLHLPNTSMVTNMEWMFSEAYSLKSVPFFDTSNVTNMEGMFLLGNFETVPLFDTSNVTNMSYMFQDCNLIKSVPLFDTSNVTNMNFMFQYCFSLESVPLFDTSNVATMFAMFYTCTSLKSIPLFDTSNVTDTGTYKGLFGYCSSLVLIPLLDLRKAADVVNMFNGCNSLSVGTLYRTRFNISYIDCKLSSSQLDEIYTNLAGLGTKTVSGATGNGTNVTYTTSTNHHYIVGQFITVTGLSSSGFNVTDAEIIDVPAANQFVVANTTAGTSTGTGTADGGSAATITVSGNWGVGDDTPSIATDKGWTVTG